MGQEGERGREKTGWKRGRERDRRGVGKESESGRKSGRGSERQAGRRKQCQRQGRRRRRSLSHPATATGIGQHAHAHADADRANSLVLNDLLQRAMRAWQLLHMRTRTRARTRTQGARACTRAHAIYLPAAQARMAVVCRQGVGREPPCRWRPFLHIARPRRMIFTALRAACAGSSGTSRGCGGGSSDGSHTAASTVHMCCRVFAISERKI